MGRPKIKNPPYRTAHRRNTYLWGSAKQYTCIKCDGKAAEWAYDGTDPSELSEIVRGKFFVKYSAWSEFYMPLCTPCHRNMDKEARPEPAHCRKGHELTSDNIYNPPKNPTYRECKICRRENARYHYLKRIGA